MMDCKEDLDSSLDKLQKDLIATLHSVYVENINEIQEGFNKLVYNALSNTNMFEAPIKIAITDFAITEFAVNSASNRWKEDNDSNELSNEDYETNRTAVKLPEEEISDEKPNNPKPSNIKEEPYENATFPFPDKIQNGDESKLFSFDENITKPVDMGSPLNRIPKGTTDEFFRSRGDGPSVDTMRSTLVKTSFENVSQISVPRDDNSYYVKNQFSSIRNETQNDNLNYSKEFRNTKKEGIPGTTKNPPFYYGTNQSEENINYKRSRDIFSQSFNNNIEQRDPASDNFRNNNNQYDSNPDYTSRQPWYRNKDMPSYVPSNKNVSNTDTLNTIENVYYTQDKPSYNNNNQPVPEYGGIKMGYGNNARDLFSTSTRVLDNGVAIKTYECKECGLTTNRNGDMHRHIKRKHRI